MTARVANFLPSTQGADQMTLTLLGKEFSQ
jgi:hypothetical protein